MRRWLVACACGALLASGCGGPRETTYASRSDEAEAYYQGQELARRRAAAKMVGGLLTWLVRGEGSQHLHEVPDDPFAR